MRKLLHKAICLLTTMSLLTGSVVMAADIDDDGDREGDFFSQGLEHPALATSIPDDHSLANTMGPGCTHCCHLVYHYLGAISTGFQLPETRPTAFVFPEPKLAHSSMFSGRLFKPPRQFS